MKKLWIPTSVVICVLVTLSSHTPVTAVAMSTKVQALVCKHSGQLCPEAIAELKVFAYDYSPPPASPEAVAETDKNPYIDPVTPSLNNFLGLGPYELLLDNFSAHECGELGKMLAGLQGVRLDDDHHRFARASTTSDRYLFWQLDLKYPPSDDRTDFTIEYILYFPSGHHIKAQIEAHSAPNLSRCQIIYPFEIYPIKDMNDWSPGRYEVDLFIKGGITGRASGTFELR